MGPVAGRGEHSGGEHAVVDLGAAAGHAPSRQQKVRRYG
jgi:hypothetical protein